jgi:probable addiction module antidote protein
MTIHSKYNSAPYDTADYLQTPEQVKSYLEAALEENDPDFFIDALAIAARSVGMTKIAATTGLGRESLYKALSTGKQPRFTTVYKVVQALGLRMQLAS